MAALDHWTDPLVRPQPRRAFECRQSWGQPAAGVAPIEKRRAGRARHDRSGWFTACAPAPAAPSSEISRGSTALRLRLRGTTRRRRRGSPARRTLSSRSCRDAGPPRRRPAMSGAMSAADPRASPRARCTVRALPPRLTPMTWHIA